ncbi:hypothetical protein [Polaribacter sargassicola]|uniref:hypothetical protein n=1 Tax=Polaribacter sargassicola TaxID=2836891 RepID=UPI001F17F433|nr:hypothetical protein [Polaribacter sp. DS7-9]MCG1036120.1 hypothetical protein [Polaribacter sp. DS7-9]
MPANTKYLTTSAWQKTAKITAGLIGGYIITALFHISLALWLSPYHKEVLITSIYTVFILWGILLIIPFLFKNGWKVWGLYLIISIVLYIIYFLGKQQNPFM